MIFAPFKNVNKLDGLIHKYHIEFSVNASSTNYRDDRINNPFTSSTDRWCSLNNGKPGEWLSVNFTRQSIYMTHFVLWSIEIYHFPVSWFAEGCNKDECYKLVEYQEESIKLREVFETKVHGPFTSFRYVSTGKDVNGTYHHCAYKLEFFGATSDYLKRKRSCIATRHDKSIFFIYLTLIIIEK